MMSSMMSALKHYRFFLSLYVNLVPKMGMGFDVSLIGVDGVGGSLCRLAMFVSFCADVGPLLNAYAQAYAMHITL